MLYKGIFNNDILNIFFLLRNDVIELYYFKTKLNKYYMN